jgi:hypothetical protein
MKKENQAYAPIAEYNGACILECPGNVPKTWNGKVYHTDGMTYLFKKKLDEGLIATVGLYSEKDAKAMIDDAPQEYMNMAECLKMLKAPQELIDLCRSNPPVSHWDAGNGCFVPATSDGAHRGRLF